MKKKLLINFVFLISISGFTQQLYMEYGSTISSFDYENSNGNPLNNLLSKSNSYFGMGYRQAINNSKTLFLSIGATYNNYGAIGSESSVDNYFEWDVTYLGIEAGLDYKLFGLRDFSFFMNDDGLSGYFASNRDGGVGSDDIYAYNRIPNLNIEGIVTDINNEPIVNATVELLDNNNNKIADLITDENGYYTINIDRDTDYKLNTKKDNYIDDSRSVTSKGLETTVKNIKANIVLNPFVKKELPITELYPIYFDFNKFDIRRDGTVELDRIVDLMINKYPSMVIKIESHTDSRGTSEYNDKLSKDRANATYKYLISNGVDPSRITEYNGFGERKLANDCDGSTNCTEDQHQLNRRTQFIVIKME